MREFLLGLFVDWNATTTVLVVVAWVLERGLDDIRVKLSNIESTASNIELNTERSVTY